MPKIITESKAPNDIAVPFLLYKLTSEPRSYLIFNRAFKITGYFSLLS